MRAARDLGAFLLTRPTPPLLQDESKDQDQVLLPRPAGLGREDLSGPLRPGKLQTTEGETVQGNSGFSFALLSSGLTEMVDNGSLARHYLLSAHSLNITLIDDDLTQSKR